MGRLLPVRWKATSRRGAERWREMHDAAGLARAALRFV
jgi:hypothetical protein